MQIQWELKKILPLTQNVNGETTRPRGKRPANGYQWVTVSSKHLSTTMECGVVYHRIIVPHPIGTMGESSGRELPALANIWTGMQMYPTSKITAFRRMRPTRTPLAHVGV